MMESSALPHGALISRILIFVDVLTLQVNQIQTYLASFAQCFWTSSTKIWNAFHKIPWPISSFNHFLCPFTDQSVIALDDKCHQFRVMGLYNCFRITDAAMYALANSSKYRLLNNAELKRRSSWRSYSNSSYSSSSSSISSDVSTSPRSSNSNNKGSTLMNRGSFSCLMREGYYGLTSLNLGMCSHLSAPAVQAVCDVFAGLHTCPERHSLIISGCLNLTSVHCPCVVEARKVRW